jgi:uncharacterized membrane protein
VAALIHSTLRKHRVVVVSATYVVAALLLGVEGGRLGFGASTSRLSSASAIAILSAIASGMMAFTGIAISLLVVAYQTGGTLYTPRLLRVMGDTSGFLGHVTGIFTGTFLYALLAIRTVDLGGGEGLNLWVVIVALAWLLASVAAVVLLIPRMRSLAIDQVLTTLHDHAARAMRRSFSPRISVAPQASVRTVAAPYVINHPGEPRYLVGFDVSALVRWAATTDAVVTIVPVVGDAVLAGDSLLSIAATRSAAPIPQAKLRAMLWLDTDRTLHNDPAYGIRLLVDIAIRALSPAVNDPSTAVSVLDQLEDLLRLIGQQSLDAVRIVDDRSTVRLIYGVPTWQDLVTLALTEISEYGRGAIQVQRRLATLVHDLLEELPADRRDTIVRFDHWRAISSANGPALVSDWADPRGYDRQGLGHERVPVEP